MTSPSDNVPQGTVDDKPRGELATIGARVTEAERLEIDVASARLAVRRGHFLVAASLVVARAIEAGDENLANRILELAQQMAA